MTLILACCLFFVSAFSYSVYEDRSSSDSMETSNGLRVIIDVEPCITEAVASGSDLGGDNVPVNSEWQSCRYLNTFWASTKGSFSRCFDCSEGAAFWADLIASLGQLSSPLFMNFYLLRETSMPFDGQGEESIEIGGPLTIIDPKDLERMIAEADYKEKDEATHCVICLSGDAESLYGHRCNGEGKDICLTSIVCIPCVEKLSKKKCPACCKAYGDKEEVTANEGGAD